jgi:hypothetical protein
MTGVSFKRDCWVAASTIGGFCAYLFLTVSCIAPAPSPLSPIYPPGWTPTSPTKVTAHLSNRVLSPIKATFAVPRPTVTLTCDFGQGPMDGVHIFYGKQVGQFAAMLTFPPTNQFAVPLDTNSPSFVELRTFVNWPAPGVIDTKTNDDGSTSSVTNTFYESTPADFVFVPTNCARIAPMQYSDHLEIWGWGNAGLIYHILSGPIGAITNDVENIPGTNGSWRHGAQASEGPFFRSMSVGP